MAVKYKRRYGSYGPLKAKRPKKKYKSLENYLKSVYRNNKDYLDSHIKTFGKTSKRAKFVEEVMTRLNQTNPDTGKKYTVKQAIEKVQRSSLITTREERIGEVRLTRMKEMDPEKFKDLRKKIGWTTKIKSENFIEMTSEGNKNYLRYKDPQNGKDVIIIEDISPKSGVATSYQILDYDEFVRQYAREHRNDSATMEALYQRKK